MKWLALIIEPGLGLRALEFSCSIFCNKKEKGNRKKRLNMELGKQENERKMEYVSTYFKVCRK